MLRRLGTAGAAALLAAGLLAACAGQGGRESKDRPAPAELPAATSGAPADWPTYHRDRLRTGYDPTVPHVNGPLRAAWSVRLDGAVYAQPLVVGGIVIAATENNTLYGLSGGRVVWQRHVAAPTPQSALPCGNVFPLGITGTPVYDAASGRVFAVASVPNPVRHVLVALNPTNGKPYFVRTIDPRGSTRSAQQQRAALTVGNGRVYVALGGLYGDCGNYHGYVVGVPTSGSGSLVVYRTPSAREAGIWAPPGPSVDALGNVYVSTGNGASTSPPYDFSDSILKLRPSDLRMVSYFAPTAWASENAGDVDLGSQGPAVLGGTYVFAAGKSGTAYVLRQSNLGGIGGQVSKRSVCASYGGTAYAAGVVYVPCADGVRAVRISSTGAMSVLWHASSSITGSPVLAGGVVWSLDTANGRLYELRPSDGSVVTSVSVGGVTRFATPVVYSRAVFVGTKTGVLAFRTS